ncbi:hypothetical protein ACFVKB_45085 [Rhodococcus sp. NPDC127530]
MSSQRGTLVEAAFGFFQLPLLIEKVSEKCCGEPRTVGKIVTGTR